MPPTRALQKRRPRTRFRVALIAFILVGVVGAATVPSALANAGPGSAEAAVAEWARTHGLGGVVTFLEQVQYFLNPPKTGGDVAGGIPSTTAVNVGTPSPSVASPSAAPSTPAGPAAPDPIAVPAGLTPMAGEGQWRNLAVINGTVAARVAQLRPDAVHTSYLVSVVWMDPQVLSFSLHPGTQVPGAIPGVASDLIGAERASVWATFNSGFQMKDANGGYWQNGVTEVPLRTGGASMVFTSDGHVSVEAWPGGNPGPGVVAVRQNLSLLIDHGVTNPSVNSSVTADWGKTVGNVAYVWRSGIGIRADGTVVVVCGNALSVATLAATLSAAGAQYAMELDINKSWTSFITYDQPGSVPHKLSADQVPSASRYLSSSPRDFVSVVPR